MVADKHPPPKPDVPEDDVPEDDDGVDEETEERQEAIRYNRILLQGSFLFFFEKSAQRAELLYSRGLNPGQESTCKQFKKFYL